MRKSIVITLLLCTLLARAQSQFSVEDIIRDVYSQLTELTESAELDYEELQMDLLDLAEHPIDLNSATENDLQKLRFLSPEQIDDILLYVYLHPMDSLYELRMISSLQDYDIRNICAFCYVQPKDKPNNLPLNSKDIARQIKHELITRIDVRNMENYINDPVMAQFRYKASYRNYAEVGLRLNRPVGGDASSLQYGGYLQLSHIGPLQSLVLGNMQAHFGQGLVLASAFHSGKTMYVNNVGYEQEGVRKLNSVDGSGLHGIGTTMHWTKGKITFTASGIYSLQKDKSDIHQHMLGTNLTISQHNWKIGITAIENIYSDSVKPYRDMAYNEHYFRGTRQAIIGLNGRYRWRWLDVFGEIAASQNTHWGVGAQVGTRLYPISGLGLTILGRYFSPWFDNTQGYAFSQTSRVNDELGIYLGINVQSIAKWRLTGYADLFRFQGIKYGIPYAPSMGYDAMFEAQYIPNSIWNIRWRVRAREKGHMAHYSTRAQFVWQQDGWSLCSFAETNMTTDSISNIGWGLSIAQDIAYTFHSVPITLQARLQGFDARQWVNRIYRTEQDVLYAFSSPAVYGRGGRAYINLRWHIIPQLSLYLRLSQTVYHPDWARLQSIPQTRTDLHVMLRATLP